MPKYYIKTYGCQMNEHDSRKIAALLSRRGFEVAEQAEQADLVLFNTCTIREKAQQKALSEIGRTAQLKAEHPHLLVGVCGCVAQQEKEALFKKFPHVDMLFGPDQIAALPQLLDAVTKEHEQVSALDLIDTPEQYQFLNLAPWTTPESPQLRETRDARRATAFVTIMKGCDANCAYCIVPKVRGREVCRPANDIIAEVRGLVAQGIREVTLLGQTVNTYGSRRHAGTIPFHELLQRIAEETDIARIRFTSPHPKDVSSGLVEAYRTNAKLCRHIHLPLQAGSDRVLRAMRRSYSRKHYLAKVDALRAACPDIAITTDMIVGFPGETEADFAETLAVTRQADFEGMYAFKYSPRPGTESFARMEDDVAEETKKDRLARLLELNNEQARNKLEPKVGTLQEVLVEGESKQGGQFTGRTTHNTIVNFTGKKIRPGDLLPIEVTKAYGHSLAGCYTETGLP